MENNKVVDKRSVKLEDVNRSDYIPFLGGRPVREAIISHDEVVNLTIQLNTIKSVDDLINKL